MVGAIQNKDRGESNPAGRGSLGPPIVFRINQVAGRER